MSSTPKFVNVPFSAYFQRGVSPDDEYLAPVGEDERKLAQRTGCRFADKLN